ncbi:hypothetical protein PBY51_023010 [Eleginops maclovinus]|nr:hypothetical protein PBY51_023010 [Eleginops maclovinus]
MRGGKEGGGSSCSPAQLPPVASSDTEDTPPVSSQSHSEESWRRGKEGEASPCIPAHPHHYPLSQSEERRSLIKEEVRGRKRKNHHRGREQKREEEDAGRFVGRMVVSFRRRRGEEEEVPITLHKFNHRKQRRKEEGETGQSEKAFSVVRQNGFRVLPHSSYSQHALHILQSTHSQSEALNISSGQWRFSDLISISSNHCALHIWSLCSSSATCFSSAPMLRLSAVAVETLSQSVRGGAYGSPTAAPEGLDGPTQSWI